VHFLVAVQKNRKTHLLHPFFPFPSSILLFILIFTIAKSNLQIKFLPAAAKMYSAGCYLFYLITWEFLCSLAIEKRLQRRGFDSAVDRQLVKLISLSPPAPVNKATHGDRDMQLKLITGCV